MKPVIIYSGAHCPYCERAKTLLKAKNIPFTDYNSRGDKMSEFMRLAEEHNHYTIPMIFIDGVFVGGCDQLMALEKSGKLNELLGNNSA